MPEFKKLKPSKRKRRKPDAERLSPEKKPKPLKVRQAKSAGKARRKRNMMIYHVMFLLITMIIFAVLSTTVLFNITEVAAEGESIYSAEEIIEAANIRLGANLLRLNTEENKRNIIDKLVYIDKVQIRKSLPGKLTIQVTGAVERFNIEHDGNYYIISGNGRILGLADRSSKNTAIYGFDPNEPFIGHYVSSQEERKTALAFTLIETAEKAGLKGIVGMDISDPLGIRMNYMNRIELVIGSGVELELKLRVAAEMLENETASHEHGTWTLIDPLRPFFIEDFDDDLMPRINVPD